MLDIGAGTGRVSLELARSGYEVTALDLDAELLDALRDRADGLKVTTVVADAREFALGRRFALCIVPMQTIQLLGGAAGRSAFLCCAREHLLDDGVLAIAIAEELEPFVVSDGLAAPLPDILELDGVVYSSRPTAVRPRGDGFVLERQRDVVAADGTISTTRDEIQLDALRCRQLEDEAIATGLLPAGRARIGPTADHVSSSVVMLSA